MKTAYDRYSIMDGYVLPPVSFSLHEALAIFLAARLVLRQSDENNSHIHSALTKLSALLPSGLSENLLRSLQTSTRKQNKPEYVSVYEKLAIGWATRRRLKIMYASLSSNETHEWLLDPYYIEMTGIGCSTYVIGHAIRKDRDGIYTFKLDRIEKAELLEFNFEILPDFDIEKLLAGSWGIVWGEEGTVKLKFSTKVCRRLKETVWHASQKITDLTDGGCMMTLKIGSTLELIP
jgi:proteasome accessory factor B